jgi:hypothetical protein
MEGMWQLFLTFPYGKLIYYLYYISLFKAKIAYAQALVINGTAFLSVSLD